MSSTPGSTSGGGSGSGSGAAKRLRLERAWRGVTGDMPLRKYTPTPTGGTAPLHSAQDIGYADFYPAKEGLSEGQLDERAIRYGHVDLAVVANEYASGHELVYERLQDMRVFQELQVFAAGAAQRQWARGQIDGADVPTLPNRTVRSDERREEWVRALANPRVPLSTLASGMPFGLRGERLLESLRTHRVPLQRAVWAIRLTGVYEMVGMQTRAPDHTSIRALEHQYTSQWSRQFTQFIEHTLAAAPTAATGGSASATPALPAATDGASPASAAAPSPAAPPWPQSWSFCLALLHTQYSQGLLDQRHMVSWLGTQLMLMPMDRCMLLLPVIKDYTGEIAKSRTPLRRLIGAVVHRIEQTAKYRALQPVHADLGEYLVELFTAHPDAFVEPSSWGQFHAALDRAVDAATEEQRKAALRRAIARVDARNAQFASLLSRAPAAARPPADTDTRLAPLVHLDALGPDSDIGKAFAQLFDASAQGVAAHTLRLLCYWAVEGQLAAATTRFRLLAAARLCRMHLDSLAEAPDADTMLHRRQVQGAIIGFLDILRLPGGPQRDDTVRRVCMLLERLADVGCFSVSQYLQLLTARGDFFGSNLHSPRSQRHLAYAASVPVNLPEDRQQCRMLICDCGTGVAAYPAAESLPACAEMRRGLSAQLPFLVAYTCAEPLRASASANRMTPAVDTAVISWWLQVGNRSAEEAGLLDRQALPTPAQLAAVPLASPLAQDVCTKDWISPVVDSAADERALGGDLAPPLQALLRDSPRAATDFVVLRRLLPVVYDYVVKDVTVGVDNWRVITQPGSSLLNHRQAALVVRVLVTAGYPAQLLDFLLWLLEHTQAPAVAALAQSTLRCFARTWVLLGRLADVVAGVDRAYHEGAAGADSFEFECYRTAHHLHATCGALVAGLLEDVARGYDTHVAAHAPMLLQGTHAPNQSSVEKELTLLAQQLARDRMRAGAGSGADGVNWTVMPCFQKLARWAAHATQRIGGGSGSLVPGIADSSPAVLPDTPGSPTAAPLQKQALQSMFGYIVAEATRAALHGGRSLAPPSSPDRLHDETLLRVQADVCAQFVRWAALGAGLLAAPESTGAVVLQALASAIGSWTLSWNSAPNSLGSAGAGISRFSTAEIEMATYASRAWVGALLASGCLRIDELLPWLIGTCSEPAAQTNAAEFACMAGIIFSLGAPSPSAKQAAADGSEGAGAGTGIPDARCLYELLEVGSCWEAALSSNRVCRIQAVELVITSASASGRLREIGASQIAVVLMQAASALAQSAWIQAIVDIIPSSAGGLAAHAGSYYTLLEIYRANIEAQIRDPSVPLPVKRAILRALMTLCEGVDPELEGFSAMTTAEVAHRLRRTIQRFWYGSAARGCASTDVSKLATILNALLLFASTALRESEASTEAFAVAAGAGAMDSASMSGARLALSSGPAARALGHGGDCVQFVTNATADLAACVQDAVFGWREDVGAGRDGEALLGRRCAALAEALATLSPDMLFQLVECFSQTLFALNLSQLRAASSGAEQPGEDDARQRSTPREQQHQQSQPQAVLDSRASALINASRADVRELVEPSLAEAKDAVDDDDNDAPDASEVARRGCALAALIRQLVSRLGDSVPADSKATALASNELLAAARDFACGILGQLQCIACLVSPVAATRLALRNAQHGLNGNGSGTPARGDSEQSLDHAAAASPVGVAPGPSSVPVTASDPARLRLVVAWRIQAVRPLCHLIRAFPDDFAVGEWLTTLVSLCLAPGIQEPSPTADGGLFQDLLDFAAVVNESLTTPIRKHALALLRSVVPLLQSAALRPEHAEILGRLLPFESSTTLTSDIAPGSAGADMRGLDNPWMWVEALEFVPLASLSASMPTAAGLEGMTPFTLRGMLEHESSAQRGRDGAAVSRAGGEDTPSRLQYLNNPHFPMQPALLVPLAETPIPWGVFGAKRRRMDAETRLIWRSRCQAAFGP